MDDDKEFRVGRPPKTRRAPIDVPTIVTSARDLLNEEGLEALSTRRLAEALGIRSASLYWHVRDKAELLQLIAESICREIELPPRDQPWDTRLRAVCHAFRARLRMVRDGAEIFMRTTPNTPARLKVIDYMFELALTAGFEGKEAVFVSSLVNDFVIVSVMDETRVSEQNETPEEHSKDAPIQNLQADNYPSISTLREHLAFDAAHFDEAFEYGLNLLIHGIQSRLIK